MMNADFSAVSRKGCTMLEWHTLPGSDRVCVSAMCPPPKVIGSVSQQCVPPPIRCLVNLSCVMLGWGWIYRSIMGILGL